MDDIPKLRKEEIIEHPSIVTIAEQNERLLDCLVNLQRWLFDEYHRLQDENKSLKQQLMSKKFDELIADKESE